MKIFESILPLKENHPFWNLAGTEPVLAFDIETTGFSPADSILYLIGLAKREGDKVRLIQLFGESLSDEAALLSRFFEMAKEADTLLHFNGEGFDIPYLRKCCRQYGMDFSLEKKKSIDIYKKIRPYKKLLPGDRLDQKSLEGLFSIPRKDTFSGGELIGV